MDEGKRDAFDKLSSTPDSIKFIPRMAGCGKSTFPEKLTLVVFYGGSAKDSTPAGCTPREKNIIYGKYTLPLSHTPKTVI